MHSVPRRLPSGAEKTASVRSSECRRSSSEKAGDALHFAGNKRLMATPCAPASKIRERVLAISSPRAAVEARLVEGDQQEAGIRRPYGRGPDAQIADPALGGREGRSGEGEARRRQARREESRQPGPARDLDLSPSCPLGQCHALPEPAHELARGAGAAGRVLPQRFAQGTPDFGRQGERGRLLLQVAGEDRHHRPLEGRFSAEELVGEDPEGVDVRRAAGPAGPDQLRSRVERRPRQRARGGRRGLPRRTLASGAGRIGEQLREAEVQDLDVGRLRSCRTEQDVARLEIAVEDACAVGGVHRTGDLFEKGERLRERQRDLRRERCSDEQLHDQVRDARRLVDPRVRDLDDVRMPEAPEGHRLAAEARESRGRRRSGCLQEFDREGLFETEVDRTVDDSEGTFPEALLQPVLAIDEAPNRTEVRRSRQEKAQPIDPPWLAVTPSSLLHTS
jgi:hypothetical protein